MSNETLDEMEAISQISILINLEHIKVETTLFGDILFRLKQQLPDTTWFSMYYNPKRQTWDGTIWDWTGILYEEKNIAEIDTLPPLFIEKTYYYFPELKPEGYTS